MNWLSNKKIKVSKTTLLNLKLHRTSEKGIHDLLNKIKYEIGKLRIFCSLTYQRWQCFGRSQNGIEEKHEMEGVCCFVFSLQSD